MRLDVLLNALAVTGTTIRYDQAEVKTMQMNGNTGRIGLQTPGAPGPEEHADQEGS